MRAFVAIELPPDVTNRLTEVQTKLQSDMPPRAVRWARPGGIHLTLKFLGEVDERQADAVIGQLSARSAQVASFHLRVRGLGCFPNARQARVVWAGVMGATDELAALHSLVEDTCAGAGMRREKRPFNPHLTLGRVRRKASRADVRRVGGVVSQGTVDEIGRWFVSEFALIKSDLRLDGAVHTTLARFPLRQSP